MIRTQLLIVGRTFKTRQAAARCLATWQELAPELNWGLVRVEKDGRMEIAVVREIVPSDILTPENHIDYYSPNGF